MLSFKKLSIPAAIGVALLVAACGGSSQSSSSSAPASGYAPSSSNSSSNTAGALTLATAKGPMGTYLVGSSGRAIYLWVADSGDRSSCAGACAKAWPPVIATSTPHVTGGVVAADLSMITRSDGTKQLAYKSHPLYYFVGDTGPGMTKGQGSNGFGAKWWLVAPSGSGIISGGSSSSSSSSSAGSSSGGSSSGGSSGGGGWG